jgi:hypothetical protein
MALRLEVPLVYVDAALAGSSAVGDGSSESIRGGNTTQFGMGDIALKYTYIPYATPKGGVLTSFEFSAPTATHDVLGTEKWVLSPTVGFGFQTPEDFVFGEMIFAPAYQHSVGVGGSSTRAEINRGILDFYMVKKFDHDRQWVVLDPTYILDYEGGKYSGMTLRATYGRELGEVDGISLSAYIKPGLGIGSDRPNDWSIEIGFTMIGF